MERQVEVRRLRGEAREAHARGALGRWERSGLSAASFARREGVSAVTLRRWREAFAGPGAGRPAAGGYIELEVSERPVARPFEVLLSQGRVVRVPAGFDEHELSRLLAALERARC